MLAPIDDPLPSAADGRFRGVLAKRDLVSVYAQEVLGRPAMLATFVRGGETEARRDYVELPPDFALRLVPVPASLVGKTLAEAALPQTAGVRVLEIKRQEGGPGGGRRVIPDAGTVLAAGDGLILLGPEETLERLEQGKPLPSKDEAEAHLAVD